MSQPAAMAVEDRAAGTATSQLQVNAEPTPIRAKASRRRQKDDEGDAAGENVKRRCVSTACIACRKRKSKCDGNLPACSSCASVYNTECIYDPNSDHRRKGVYKKDIDKLKTRNSTLEVLIQAILNYPEEQLLPLCKLMRTCESLDTVAEGILTKDGDPKIEDEDLMTPVALTGPEGEEQSSFERQLAGKMGGMRLDKGVMRYIGGTSHLIFPETQSIPAWDALDDDDLSDSDVEGDPILSWTSVTTDAELITHLINMYFTWHWEYFACVPKTLFYQDFKKGTTASGAGRKYCTPLLANAMLALGCHFTARPGARLDPDDPATAGDHFSKEAKRLMLECDEHEKPSIPTVQALALMSVREAGCGREAKGWVYSGMSFRMACDFGLNLDAGGLASAGGPIRDELEEDARRVTFWGCFLFDKCWSNYLGRMPQLPRSIVTIPKFEVIPAEDQTPWVAYTDSGYNRSHEQPSRTRAVALQISTLCDISGDLMAHFYNPTDIDKVKGKQAELKKLSDIHQRLETWKRDLPKEFEPREGLLPSMLVAHMFFQLLYIHLFRPFLQYAPQNSPLPSNVSPRKLCTTAAAMISKLLRLYKRSHGLRQICNIVVYITQNACTIHLLNLPEKNARRDITHGMKHLEEIAEIWPCARRALSILCVLSKEWQVELPEEASTVLARCEERFGPFKPDYNATSTRAKPASPRLRPRNLSMSPPQISPRQENLMPQPQQSLNQDIPPLTPASQSYTTPTLRQVSTIASPSAHPPPMTAHDFHIYPRSTILAAQTPNTTGGTPGRVSSHLSTGSISHLSNGSRGSPDDMFGGVDQLLRTSSATDRFGRQHLHHHQPQSAGSLAAAAAADNNGQDWWLKDQSQLAVGFGNWSGTFGGGGVSPATAEQLAMDWMGSASGHATSSDYGNRRAGAAPVAGSLSGGGALMDLGGVQAMAYPGAVTNGGVTARAAAAAAAAAAAVNGIGANGNGAGAGGRAPGLGGSVDVNGYNGLLGYDNESQWYL